MASFYTDFAFLSRGERQCFSCDFSCIFISKKNIGEIDFTKFYYLLNGAKGFRTLDQILKSNLLVFSVQIKTLRDIREILRSFISQAALDSLDSVQNSLCLLEFSNV